MKPTVKISVLIPTRGDAHLLPRSLGPLLDLGRSDVELVVINNDPERDVRTWLREIVGPAVRVIDTGFDAGFIVAINRGIRATTGELVLISNPDVLLTETYLPEIERLFERRPGVGCATGKILRYELEEDRATNVIDTTGLSVGRNRRAVDRGEGQPDVGQYDSGAPEQVFGVSGSALVARRAALEDVRVGDEYLDESFYMYKDDIDLSWRLRLLGWECWYVPTAIAYHGRTSRGPGGGYLKSPLEFHRAQRAKPFYIRMNSMKNQWLMLVKNEDWHNFWRDLPYIAARELLVLSYNLLFSPRAVLALPKFAAALPSALAKRREIKHRQVLDPHTLRRWFR